MKNTITLVEDLEVFLVLTVHSDKEVNAIEEKVEGE